MKLSRKSTNGRARCQPRIRFETQTLTSFAGAVIYQELFKKLDLKERFRKCFQHLERRTIYSFHTLYLVLVMHLVLGWKRLRDINYYRHDPLVNRAVGLKRLPDQSTMSRFLASADQKCVERVGGESAMLVRDRLGLEQMNRITLDYDGTVLSTKARGAEGTAIGFNKKKKGARSYYPLFCTVAQLGMVLDLRQRSGNVHDSNGAVEFIEGTVESVRQACPGSILEARLDSAHFNDRTVFWLDDNRIEFSASVPFQRSAELKGMIEDRKRWRRIDDEWAFFENEWKPKKWPRNLRFLFFRRKRNKPLKGPIQLDLFEPRDTEYEFKVVVTNKSLSAKSLLLFHNGRGSQEGIFAELKSQCAMGYIPTKRKAGNTLWLHATVFAHNLTRELQMLTGERQRTTSAKRSCLYVFEQMHSFRRRVVQRAGRLTMPGRVLTLTISATKGVASEITGLIEKLAA